MNHSHIDTIINPGDFAAIVSLGNKCPTAMLLSSIGIYNNSFPFDWIPSTPELILKYMKDQTDFYPRRDHVLNMPGMVLVYEFIFWNTSCVWFFMLLI